MLGSEKCVLVGSLHSACDSGFIHKLPALSMSSLDSTCGKVSVLVSFLPSSSQCNKYLLKCKTFSHIWRSLSLFKGIRLKLLPYLFSGLGHHIVVSNNFSFHPKLLSPKIYFILMNEMHLCYSATFQKACCLNLK